MRNIFFTFLLLTLLKVCYSRAVEKGLQSNPELDQAIERDLYEIQSDVNEMFMRYNQKRNGLKSKQVGPTKKVKNEPLLNSNHLDYIVFDRFLGMMKYHIVKENGGKLLHMPETNRAHWFMG